MSLIQNNNLVLEQIRVVDALTNKNTVRNVPQRSLLTCIIIKSYRVSYFLTRLARPFVWDSIGHTDCSHSARLSDDDVDSFDGLYRPLSVFLNLILVLDDGFANDFWVHHVLRQLGGFTRTGIAGNYTKVILCNCIFNLLSVLVNWQTLLKLPYLLFLHDADWMKQKFFNAKI